MSACVWVRESVCVEGYFNGTTLNIDWERLGPCDALTWMTDSIVRIGLTLLKWCRKIKHRIAETAPPYSQTLAIAPAHSGQGRSGSPGYAASLSIHTMATTS